MGLSTAAGTVTVKKKSKYFLHKSCAYGPTNIYTLSSPIGKLLVTSCPHGLHSIRREEKEISDSTFPKAGISVQLLNKEWEDNGYMYKPAVQCISWFETYFGDIQQAQSLPLPPLCPSICSSKGSFREKAWLTLAEEVTLGKVVSYGQLAKMSGNSLAARAVGSAMKNNPFLIMVPCHRVIRGNNTVGLYAGTSDGSRVKKWLLKHEGVETVL